MTDRITILFFAILASGCTKNKSAQSDVNVTPLNNKQHLALRCDGVKGPKHTRTLFHRTKMGKFIVQTDTYNEGGRYDRTLSSETKDLTSEQVTNLWLELEKSYGKDVSGNRLCNIFEVEKTSNPYFLKHEKSIIIPKNFQGVMLEGVQGTSNDPYLRLHVKDTQVIEDGYILKGVFEDDYITFADKITSPTEKVDHYGDLSMLNKLALYSPAYGEVVAAFQRDEKIVSNNDMMGNTPQRFYGYLTEIGFSCDKNDHILFNGSFRRMVQVKLVMPKND